MYSIRIQFLLLVYLPLSLASTAVVWKTFDVVESLVERRLEKEIELVARTMRLPVEQAMRDGALDRIEHVINATFEINRVYGAYVYDTNGRRIALAGNRQPDPQERIEAVNLVRQGEELGRYVELSGEPVFSYFVPLTGLTGRFDGLLQVVRLKSEITESLEGLRRTGWIVWTAVLVGLLGIVVLGHRTVVGRPLDRIVASMARVEAGDHGHRARVTGPRELRTTATAMNRMLNGIEEMQDKLDRERSEHQRLTARMHRHRHLATLGRFSSGVAHELGAPLTVIDGDARRLLQQSPKQSTDERRRLNRIREQIQRTRELIAQLMEFARGEPKRKQATSVHALLQRVRAAVKPEAEARGVRVAWPAVDPGLKICVHAIRLEHALLNLVRNAVGMAAKHVRVQVVDDQGRIVIAVEDDGPGVPESERQRVFEPFYSRREGRSGVGLGLAIVRSVAEDHDAELRVDESKSLGGGRFEMILAASR